MDRRQMAAAGGFHQGLLIAVTHRSTAGDELADRGAMTGHGGGGQRTGVVVVAGEGGSAFGQGGDDRPVASLRRHADGGVAGAVPCADAGFGVGAATEQRAHHRVVTGGGGQMQRRTIQGAGTSGDGGVDVGAGFQQDFGDFRMTGGGGQVQGGMHAAPWTVEGGVRRYSSTQQAT